MLKSHLSIQRLRSARIRTLCVLNLTVTKYGRAPFRSTRVVVLSSEYRQRRCYTNAREHRLCVFLGQK